LQRGKPARRRRTPKHSTVATRGVPIVKTIGKYRILGPLGHGGMGVVYRAVDTTLERDVAIKVLHRSGADRGAVERFQAEATTLARLNHPDITTIYELFRSRHDLLLVMEFARGETLESVCARLGALPSASAASIADRILSALDHAHVAGIVHCDIKPANVMVTGHGGVKIMDFGTARVRGTANGTIDGYTVGTPAYMSPEQLLGDEVDGRSDIYSVGVVLYRLLTGTLPFDGDTTLAVAQQHVAHAPAPPQSHREGLPDWCEPILRRALAKSPGERFQTARGFRDELRRATGMTEEELGRLGAIAVQPSETTTSLPSPAVVRSAARANRRASTTLALKGPSRTVSMFRTARRRRTAAAPISRRAVAIGAAAAMLTVGVAVLAMAPSGATPPSPPPAASAAGPVVMQALALEPGRSRQRETACRLVLSADRIVVTASDTSKPLHEVPYADVLSVSYSRSVDPPAATRPRVSARVAEGEAEEPPGRDWVSVRTKRAKSQFFVLRFNGEADARRAVAAIDARRATPSRGTPESTR
jgi:serine/threonine-protein kinase